MINKSLHFKNKEKYFFFNRKTENFSYHNVIAIIIAPPSAKNREGTIILSIRKLEKFNKKGRGQ